jgi:hypothetical protein
MLRSNECDINITVREKQGIEALVLRKLYYRRSYFALNIFTALEYFVLTEV